MEASSLQIIDVKASDGRVLDGMLAEPARAARASIVVLHGKGGNCMSGPARTLLEGLVAQGLRVLSLNMRCHDLAYTRQDLPGVDFHEGDPVLSDGGAWESLETGVLDVGAGVGFLRARGEEPVFIVGHSSGGFHAATYAAADPGLAGLAFLSPLLSNRRPFAHWFGSPEREAATLAEAEQMVADGRGDLLIPLDSWYYAISARSLLERAAEPEGIWLDSVAASPSPVLLLWGGGESRAPQWSDTFEQLRGRDERPVHGLEIADAEHNYLGYETAVVDTVAAFVRRWS